MLNGKENGFGNPASTPHAADAVKVDGLERSAPPEARSVQSQEAGAEARKADRASVTKLMTPELVEQAWEHLVGRTSPELVDDLRNVLRANAKGAQALQYRRGSTSFFDWVSSADQGAEEAIVAAFYSKPSEDGPSQADVQRVSIVFESWYERQLSERGSQIYAFDMARATAYVLQWLGELPAERYPKYLRRFHRVEKPDGDTPSLGSLGWAELAGSSGYARERKALAIVARAAASDFEFHRRLFDFGQSVLAAQGPPEEVDAEAWLALRRLLDFAREALSRPVHARKRPASAFAAGCDAALRSSATWLAAGLPRPCVDAAWAGKHEIDQTGLGWLALGCLASTKAAVIAAATMFVCRTGWNKQPTLDLASQPIVFETLAGTGVASAKFLASFKRRARHHVLARLEDCRKVDGLLREDLDADWHAAGAELAADDGDEGSVILDRSRDGEILSMIEAFGRMADAARALDPLRRDMNHFFVHVALARADADGPATQARFGLKLSSAEVLRRDGVTFRSIRKTVLVIKYARKGSVAATVPHAGHADGSQLLRSYLNTPDVKAGHDSAIRAYQQACQALLLAGDPARRIALRIPVVELDWFLGLARASGIAAGLGVSPGVPPGPPPAPLFHPTESNLRDLFLAHWALRRAATLLPPGTWRARCLPLLAAARVAEAIML